VIDKLRLKSHLNFEIENSCQLIFSLGEVLLTEKYPILYIHWRSSKNRAKWKVQQL